MLFGGGVSGGGASGAGAPWVPTYDWVYDGNPQATLDFTDLGSANEILMMANDILPSAADIPSVRFSVNNGQSFYSGNTDYKAVSTNLIASNVSMIQPSPNGNAFARTFAVHIINNTDGVRKAVFSNFNWWWFMASLSPINAIRLFESAGQNIIGGSVEVFTR